VTSKAQALPITLKQVLLEFEPKNPYLKSYLIRYVPVISQNLFALFNTLTILNLIFKTVFIQEQCKMIRGRLRQRRRQRAQPAQVSVTQEKIE
jgi:hypothetical protein